MLKYKIIGIVPPQLNGKGMQKDIDAIGKVGVTKRIGSSVLDELDERAGEKISELKPGDFNRSDTNDGRNHELSKHFQNVHESQFNGMESLESHYINSSLPQTPKRHVENNDNEFSNPKKLKLPIPPSSPPVHDITKRIRRLRIRNSLTGGNSNQSRTPTQTALKSTPLTKQRPMDPPRFLRPTVNSLKKNVDTSSFIRNKESRDDARGTTRAVPRNHLHQPQPMPQREKHPMPRSQSVFERLYSQTTIARSCSMGNVSVKSHTQGIPSRSRERDNNTNNNIINYNGSANANANASRNANARANANSNRTKMTRSKTSGSLSSQLDRPAWK